MNIPTVASQIVNRRQASSHIRDMYHAYGERNEVKVLGILPGDKPDTVEIFFIIVPFPEPVMLPGKIDMNFKLDSFRGAIMDDIIQYAREFGDDVRRTDAAKIDVSGPHIDDALLDSIESYIKEGTKLWIGK